MRTSRSLSLLIVGLAVAVAAGGCVKKKGRGAGAGFDDNPWGVTGSQFGDDELADRPDDYELVDGRFTGVYFDYDSAQINPSDRVPIETVADYLRGSPDQSVIVEGHCDERGSREYNLALGERRALAVRAYLVGLGIDGGRVQTKSYGEEKPVAFGHEEGSWQLNRRAEFVVFY